MIFVAFYYMATSTFSNHEHYGIEMEQTIVDGNYRIEVTSVEKADIAEFRFTVLTPQWAPVNVMGPDNDHFRLTGYPSALRGALTGPGSLEVQLKITCPGPMDKAEVESRCESLPKFDNANYQARLSIETKASSQMGDSNNVENDV